MRRRLNGQAFQICRLRYRCAQVSDALFPPSFVFPTLVAASPQPIALAAAARADSDRAAQCASDHPALSRARPKVILRARRPRTHRSADILTTPFRHPHAVASPSSPYPVCMASREAAGTRLKHGPAPYSLPRAGHGPFSQIADAGALPFSQPDRLGRTQGDLRVRVAARRRVRIREAQEVR